MNKLNSNLKGFKKAKEKKEKKRFIRNGVVYDPNIDKPHFTDYDYEENEENKKVYLKGKSKRKVYHGV
jgi:hypothetical protein